jgi:uncharacterized protein YnzC (UPF0291/DUF896 family)
MALYRPELTDEERKRRERLRRAQLAMIAALVDVNMTSPGGGTGTACSIWDESGNDLLDESGDALLEE